MAQLAALTDQGRLQFKRLLVDAPSLDLEIVEENVTRIATSPALSKPLGAPVSVRLLPSLASRGDTARWVDGLLVGTGIEAGPGTATQDLFSWLALVALPSLCKRTTSGRLAVKDVERYLQSREERGFYRHLVSGPYWLHRKFGDDAKLFLCQPATEMPDIQEQIISRPWLRESHAVMQLLHRLYWDESALSPKAGFTATDRGGPRLPGMGNTRPRPGTLRALEVLLGQLQCTHDLQSMSLKQLVERLPPEFGQWLQEAAN